MAGQRQTWDLDDFGAGIDLRAGQWSRNQSRWRELRNCRTTKGRKPRRRCPVGKLNVALDAACKGLFAIDGAHYTIAKKGDTITHTGADAGLVTTLYFDNPDLCTGWELGEFQVFDGYAQAWIIHDFPSATYPKLAMLHVWDGLVFAPTYTQDPYLPGSFSPSIADLTDQVYSSTFRPVLGSGASKTWTSTIRGNAHASRTADARVWNQRTLDSFKEDGESWCFVVPEGLGIMRRFIVPRNAADLSGDGRWAYYVLERAVGGAWVSMEEVDTTTTPPAANGTWQAQAVPSRFAGGWDEIAIDVRWPSDDAGLIRLRLVSGATAVEITTEPTVTVALASAGLWNVEVTETVYRYRGGDSVTVPADTSLTAQVRDAASLVAGRRYRIKTVGTSDFTLVGASANTIGTDFVATGTTTGTGNAYEYKAVVGQVESGKTYLLAVSADPTLHPRLVDITGGFDLTGWQREHRCFYKQIVAGATEVAVTDYLYAFESDTDSAWFTNLVVEYVDLFGAEDALSLATAAIDNTGGSISSIGAVRNRMLVTYPGSMQLWGIDQDTNRTTFLDQVGFGTDDQDRPSPVNFYGAIMVPTVAGFRAMSVVGALTDSLQDANLGEPVAGLAPLTMRGAAFWPYFGSYVAAGIRDGELVFQVLDYSRESKITAWATWGGADTDDTNPWTDAGLTDIDTGTLVAAGDRLYWRSGSSIYYFDASATVFRDWCDTPGAAYESFGRLHFNDMGKPGLSKRFVGFDIVQEGRCTIGFELPPFGAWGETGGPQLAGPVVIGTTYGRARLPMAGNGPAIAPTFSSRCEEGWELQRIAIDFLMMRR